MDVGEALEHVHLFSGVEAADLAALADIAEPVFFANGEMVFDGARPAEALILLVLGTVDLTNEAKEIVLATVGSGQMLGQVAFFIRGPRKVSAVAHEPTRALRIPFEKLDALLAAQPGLAATFYRNLAAEFAHHLTKLAADREYRYL